MRSVAQNRRCQDVGGQLFCRHKLGAELRRLAADEELIRSFFSPSVKKDYVT